MSIGSLNVAFDARPKMMEVVYDPVTQQQLLSCSLLLQVSLPHLLQELLSFQQRNEGGDGAPRSMPPQASQPSASGMQLQSAELMEMQAMGSLAKLKNRQASQSSPSMEKLQQAVRQGDIAKAADAIKEGADVSQYASGPQRPPLLHMALEAGGRMDMVSLLLQARCDVNDAATDGKTALHTAIMKYDTMSPLVARALLSAKADLSIPDSGNVTPLDCVKQIAKQSAAPASSPLRQLLDEVNERPTVAVAAVENEQVLGATFADAENDKVVFYTEVAVGVYSLSRRQTQWKLNLNVNSFVRGLAVNPKLGTISIVLEVNADPAAEVQTVQQLIIVWPTGYLQQEEPLKLSVGPPTPRDDEGVVPPAIVSSITQSTLTLLTRTRDAKVICWRLNAACSQLNSEHLLKEGGGLIAIADDGQWLAVENPGGEGGGGQVEVWTFQRTSKRMRKSPKRIASVDTSTRLVAGQPVEHLAIMSRESDNSCLLATVRASAAGCLPACVEVVSVQADGSTSTAYRVEQESPCRALRFCYDSPDFLLTGHANGTVLVYGLLDGKLRRSCEDPDFRSVSISVDRTLIVTTIKDCIRIFRTADEDK